MKNKKILIILAIALLISLTGCGGNSAGNDVAPSNSIESTQTPSESPETPPEATQSTSQTQDPPQNEEPAETAQTPAESEEPTTSITKQPEETAPASTPATSTPAHTHNYASTITTQATCGNDGTRTYTCSCGDSYTEAIKATGNHTYNSTITKQPNCAEEGTKSNTCAACGYTYTEAIARTDHNWATRHVDEVGHMESTGTHIVRHYVCACGNFDAWGDNPNYEAKRNAHYDPFNNGCAYGDTVWEVEKPNNPTYVVDTPAHDETYCVVCGTIQY